MKRIKFTEEQIIAVLKEAEAGVKTGDLAWRHGVFDEPGCRNLSGVTRDAGAPKWGNPRGVSLNNWAASMGHYKRQVPHAPVTSTGKRI